MKTCRACGAEIEETAFECPECGGYCDGMTRRSVRCACGSVLAKETDETLEIKCRRCKRIHVIYKRSFCRAGGEER